ncbi:MAG: flagellar hook basal-body protein [Planctomycetota bacterium]
MSGYGETALVRSMAFLAEKQAAIANNLANVDTTSFKRRAAFAQDTGPAFHSILERQMSAIDYVERSDMQRGVLRETGNTLDIALDGPQWLRVRDGKGNDYYTRNGQMTIANDGRLATRDGLSVLDQGGQPIVLGAGGEAPSSLSFSPNGTVIDPSTGRTWGPLAMVELPDPEALTPVGKSLFIDPKKQTGRQSAAGLQQGYLEGSNVDSLQELVDMITVERSFSATQKALSGINRLQENLITNILK